MFATIFIGLFILILYYKIIKPYYFWKKRQVFHVSPLGGLHRLLFGQKSFMEYTILAYSQYTGKRYYGSYQFLRPSLFIRDLDLIKQITVKDFDHFTDHVNFTSAKYDPLTGKNLFALKGQQWRDLRSTLSPAFTSNKMKAMFILILEAAENFANYFDGKAGELIEVECKDVYTKYTNDVIATCAFGIKCNSMENPENEFYQIGKFTNNLSSGLSAVKGLFNILFPDLFEMLRIPLFPRNMSEFFLKIVEETMEHRQKYNIVRPDMIHLLMEAKNGNLKKEKLNPGCEEGFATVMEEEETASNRVELSLEIITAQAFVFFFAGFETSSTVLSMLSYELALNESIQTKLKEEIDDVVHKSGLSYDSVLKMKYLDQVICETLRKWNPAFAVNRMCTKEYVIPPKLPNENNVILEKGHLVMIPIAGLHYDPEYFPNPDVFDPDRFSDANKCKIIPGSYMPFGSGPRNCIGSRFALLEIKALLATLLLRFEFVATKKTKVPLNLAKSLGLQVKDGIWVGFRKRKKENIFS